MLTLDIVDFTEYLNSQLMQLTRFKLNSGIQKIVPGCFVLQGSEVNQVKYVFSFLVFLLRTRTIYN